MQKWNLTPALVACAAAGLVAGCEGGPTAATGDEFARVQGAAEAFDWNSCYTKTSENVQYSPDIRQHCIEQWGNYANACDDRTADSWQSGQFYDHTLTYAPGKRCSELESVVSQDGRVYSCRYGAFDAYNVYYSGTNLASTYECSETPSASNVQVTWIPLDATNSETAAVTGRWRGSYTYAQSHDGPEAVSEYAWEYADDAYGESPEAVSTKLMMAAVELDAIAQAHIAANSGNPRIRFCVRPTLDANDDANHVGSTQCSDWHSITAAERTGGSTVKGSLNAAEVSLTLKGALATGSYVNTMAGDQTLSGTTGYYKGFRVDAHFRWLRADDAAGTNATELGRSRLEWGAGIGRNRFLEPEDEGKYLRFCVTQANFDTDDTGNEVCSSWTSVGHLVRLYGDADQAETSVFFGWAYERSPAGTCFNLTDVDYLNDTMSSYAFASPTPSNARLIFYKDANCSGTSAEQGALANGTYLGSLSTTAVGNDALSSFRVAWGDVTTLSNVSLTISGSTATGSYSYSNDQGVPDASTYLMQRGTTSTGGSVTTVGTSTTYALTGNDDSSYLRFCVTTSGLSAQTVCSSWVYTGSVLELYADANFSGTSKTISYQHLPMGACINLSTYGMNDVVSSLRLNPPPGMQAGMVAYTDADCAGTSYQTTAIANGYTEVASLSTSWGTAFQDSISSVKIGWGGNPVASGLTLAFDGPSVTGSWNYSDASGLSELGSITYVQRADDTAGTNVTRLAWSSNWVLTGAEENKYLQLSVQPMNLGGKGTQVWSAYKPVGKMLSLYQNSSFGGTSAGVAYERITNATCVNASQSSFNDKASSWKLSGTTGYTTRAVFYADANCSGSTFEATASSGGVTSASSLSSSWNDAISSYRVIYANDASKSMNGTCYGTGTTVLSNEYMTFDFQTDGNLVLYKKRAEGNSAAWASGTNGKSATRVCLQSDGNLVVYATNTALWSSKTAGSGATTLKLQTDCNLVLYTSAGSAKWKTDTNSCN